MGKSPNIFKRDFFDFSVDFFRIFFHASWVRILKIHTVIFVFLGSASLPGKIGVEDSAFKIMASAVILTVLTRA